MERDINFKNFQLFFSAQEELIRATTLELLAQTLQEFLDSPLKLVHVNINLISSKEMREINFSHRQKDKSTDVLSFPQQENYRQGNFEVIRDELQLGDILISIEDTAKQAQEFGISFEREFIHLACHGFLHLLGYDHEVSAHEEQLMERFECELMDIIDLKFNKC